MSAYALSVEADRDIESIARFTTDRWGWRQANTYLSELHDAFGMLGGSPQLGRRIDHVRAGYLRFEHARHTIFYRRTVAGILVVRVLHSRMRADDHL